MWRLQPTIILKAEFYFVREGRFPLRINDSDLYPIWGEIAHNIRNLLLLRQSRQAPCAGVQTGVQTGVQGALGTKLYLAGDF